MGKINLRTPLTYYGGKQRMAVTILRLIPERKMYAGPFTGGAAVYFAKAPSKAEVINDTNWEPANFYEVPGGHGRANTRQYFLLRHARRLFPVRQGRQVRPET